MCYPRDGNTGETALDIYLSECKRESSLWCVQEIRLLYMIENEIKDKKMQRRLGFSINSRLPLEFKPECTVRGVDKTPWPIAKVTMKIWPMNLTLPQKQEQKNKPERREGEGGKERGRGGREGEGDEGSWKVLLNKNWIFEPVSSSPVKESPGIASTFQALIQLLTRNSPFNFAQITNHERKLEDAYVRLVAFLHPSLTAKPAVYIYASKFVWMWLELIK